MTIKKKYNVIKNNFTIFQIKKMIGKKLIIISPVLSVSMSNKLMANNIKLKILENKTNSKNLIITTMCKNGILFVIKNIEIFLAIDTLSYKELEYSKNMDINVSITQYPCMTKTEIKELIIL